MYLTTLLTQLTFKSGTATAEGYEARISTTFLLKIVNEFEINISTECKLPPKICEALLGKISENVHNGEKSEVGDIGEKMIVEWEPKKCNSEEGIKKAMEGQREVLSNVHFAFLRNAMAEKDWVIGAIRERPGASTRVRALVNDENLYDQLTESIGEQLTNPEVNLKVRKVKSEKQLESEWTRRMSRRYRDKLTELVENSERRPIDVADGENGHILVDDDMQIPKEQLDKFDDWLKTLAFCRTGGTDQRRRHFRERAEKGIWTFKSRHRQTN
uniref:Uncharacterized protein n=1 Tax=Globodera pallida TaxID=36090 RepID=A0A183BI25_GLOPA